jgi:hypothetical protein
LASSLAAPPEQGIAFYINDFNLSSPLPWHLPEQIGRPGPEPALRSLEAIWQEPNRSAFHAVFLDAMEAIRQRRVLKVVPAATAAAYVIADPGPTLHGLVHPHRSSGRGQAAAWSDGRHPWYRHALPYQGPHQLKLALWYVCEQKRCRRWRLLASD